MADELRERLLATYADMGEAMVVQNVLEAGGVPCRLADLEQLPSHMFGIAGAMGRSVALWVLEADVERATSLVASAGVRGHAVDEEELAAEALAAGRDGAEPLEDEEVAPEPPRRPSVRATRFPWLAGMGIATLAVLAALLGSRGCG